MNAITKQLLAFFTEEKLIAEYETAQDQYGFNYLVLEEYRIVFQVLDLHTLKLLSSMLSEFSLPDFPQYQLMKLWEDQWVRKNALVKNKIKDLLGKRKVVFGRHCTVKRINREMSKQFLNQHHILGSTNAYYQIGLFKNEQLMACASFSKSRNMKDGIAPYKSYEWVRYASVAGTSVTGGMGKCLHFFIDLVQPAHLMTYTDNDWGSGASYAHFGFKQAGIKAPQPFWINLKTYERVWKEGEVTNESVWVKAYNSGNKKFIRHLYTAHEASI